MYIKQIIALSSFVMTALWVVVNFLYIIIKGQTVIGFESYLLNIAELIFASLILALALERWYNFIIKGRR